MADCYKYEPEVKAYMWLRRIGSLTMLIFSIYVLYGASYVQIRDVQFYPVPFCFSIGFFIVISVFFAILFNLTPDICVDEEYLYIDFFFRQTKARLADIVQVKEVIVPSLKKPRPFVILFRKGLTPLHRFYGSVYSRSFYPGVYVDSSISDRHRLERIIQRHLR